MRRNFLVPLISLVPACSDAAAPSKATFSAEVRLIVPATLDGLLREVAPPPPLDAGPHADTLRPPTCPPDLRCDLAMLVEPVVETVGQPPIQPIWNGRFGFMVCSNLNGWDKFPGQAQCGHRPPEAQPLWTR